MDGIVSRWRTPANRESTTPERCPRCGAPIAFSKMSIGEIAASVVGGCLLLSILIPAGLVAEHWLEDAGRHFTDRMIWREPVDRW